MRAIWWISVLLLYQQSKMMLGARGALCRVVGVVEHGAAVSVSQHMRPTTLAFSLHASGARACISSATSVALSSRPLSTAASNNNTRGLGIEGHSDYFKSIVKVLSFSTICQYQTQFPLIKTKTIGLHLEHCTLTGDALAEQAST